MPAMFTHYRVGIRAAKLLDGEIREKIVKFIPTFETGCQGPDIFFFYKPYSSNAVSEYGHKVHSQVARGFFEKAAEIVREKGVDSNEYAYALGVICHYILDSKCHPYINQCEAETGISHMEIEEELEKYMLVKDEKDPYGFCPKVLISVEEKTVNSIAPFYDEVTLSEIYKSIGWLKFVKSLFTAPEDIKYNTILRVMKLIGKYDKWRYLINLREDNPACAPFNEHLYGLIEEAVVEAAEAMKNFEAHVKDGTPLSERFDRTFG